MGNSKSLYSKQDLLYYYIEKKDTPNIRKIIETNPEIINDPVIKDNKHTALMRASFNGNLQIVQLLLSFNADPNYVTPKGQTALSTAVKRCHIEVAASLIQGGANITHTTPLGFRIIDYAILGGFYQLARMIWSKLEKKAREDIQEPQFYEKSAKKYSYRYVNYEIFLKGLVTEREQSELPNFLKKEKKKLNDPVCDPRQTWKEWFKRQMDWKDAPLVQRSTLPENLQPQNRMFGKVHHYTNNWMSTHMTQKTSLHPQEKPELMSELNELNNKKENLIEGQIQEEAPQI